VEQPNDRLRAVFNIGVVAHLARAGQAKHLAREVKADFISIDNGMLGCDDNHTAVQHHLANIPSTWSVVLEDDAQPVNGFRLQLQQALVMAPSPVVSLYLGRKNPVHWQNRMKRAIKHAQAEDASWIISTHLLHGVGYAIKTSLLPSLLAHDSDLPCDQHIGHWARQFGHTIAYTHPSLVDHADTDTLVNHPDGKPRLKGRKAWTTGTRKEWTSRAVTM